METQFRSTLNDIVKGNFGRTSINPSIKSIVIKLCDDIRDTTEGKLVGMYIIDSSISSIHPAYDVYLNAKIGGGYIYPLFRVEPLDFKTGEFPVRLLVGKEKIEFSGQATNEISLVSTLNNALKDPLVASIIQNLLSQVDQYNT